MDQVSKYIKDHWDDTTRFNPEDSGNLIGLPEKYNVPCLKGSFQELYYWDTYFICRGLALQGRRELVRSNIKNFFFELKRFGFIPNGSRTFYLNRSQPPFLGALVELMLELYPEDMEFRAEAFEALKQEISFWDSRRLDMETGLYHYGSDPSEAVIEEFFQVAVMRRRISPQIHDEKLRRKISLATLAEAESGWDFTPRFEGNCQDYAAIDLNSLIFLSLNVMAKLAPDVGCDAEIWQNKAEKLRSAIRKYCRRDDGVFLDCNLYEKRLSKVLSAASLYPLWTGLADEKEAAAARNICCAELEYPFGISATVKLPVPNRQQWEYPNAWPCMQLICFEALARYGYMDDAARIAQKYVDTVMKNFISSGDLWEKYNAVDGSVKTAAEYKTPAMMGWSAGAYLAAKNFLRMK